jgi:hypothetical protein
MMLKIIIIPCPIGLPFAQKISAVVPISDAISERMPDCEKRKKKVVISVTELSHNIFSKLVK